MVRISAKYDDEPLREEFNDWIAGGNAVGRKPTIFHMLMCRFREMSGRLEFDSIEKDFKYPSVSNNHAYIACRHI